VNAVGGLSSVHLFGIPFLSLSLATAIALLATAFTLVARYILKPGEKWRNSRYLAERTATLAWRYADRATPSDLDRGQNAGVDANQWYMKRIHEVFTEAEKLSLPEVDRLDQLTPRMSALRNAPSDQRFKAYLEGRAIEKRNAYNRRARVYRRRRTVWRSIVALTYIVGAGLVLAHATPLRDLVPFGLLATNYWPFVAVAAGSVTGYVASRHYDELQESFRYVRDVLAAEIEGMKGFTPTAATAERDLSEWVDRVETLLDAEHQQRYILN
jgi:hypothetical protein